MFLFLVLAAFVSPSTASTTTTSLGSVRGKLRQLPDSSLEVYEFLGVPFAEPPIGDLRFRKPEAKKAWSDVLDATKRPNSCPQLLDTLFGDFEGATMWNANTNRSEDCLYLNIWVPKDVFDQRDSQGPVHPVLVWMFGGGFTSGTATLDLYDGAILAGYNNIIVASMQYRLGALGSLYYGTADAPGNMGMWDQLMALKWLCDNVDSFGGDCGSTTIFGESAGAASVAIHLLSPYSRRYFQRAILQSSSALSGWACLSPEEATWRSDELVAIFKDKCPAEPQNEADKTQWKIDCLRSLDYMDLPNEEWNVLATEPFGYAQFPFVPVVDGDFLPRHPRDMLAAGESYDVPILAGFNENEGTYFMVYTTLGYELFPHPNEPDKEVELTRSDYNDMMKEFFAYTPHFNTTSSPSEISAIKNLYRPHSNSNEGILDAVDAATGDWSFASPTVAWADSYIMTPPFSNQKVFMYHFAQRASNHPWPEWMGVAHGDEIAFVFGQAFNTSSTYTEDEKTLTRYMMAYWANFAKLGDPNVPDQTSSNQNNLNLPTWPEYSLSDKAVFELSVDALVTKTEPPVTNAMKAQETAFWYGYFPRLRGSTGLMQQLSLVQPSWDASSWSGSSPAGYMKLDSKRCRGGRIVGDVSTNMNACVMACSVEPDCRGITYSRSSGICTARSRGCEVVPCGGTQMFLRLY